MNLSIVLYGPEEVVEGIAGLSVGQGGEGPLGKIEVSMA